MDWPIVATDAGDNKKLVISGRNGFVCDLRDKIGIGNALLELVHSKDKRSAFGKYSFEHISQNYHLDRFAERYLAFVHSVL